MNIILLSFGYSFKQKFIFLVFSIIMDLPTRQVYFVCYFQISKCYWHKCHGVITFKNSRSIFHNNIML